MLASQLMSRCLVEGDFLLRSGRRSTEKFDFERVTTSRKWNDKMLVRRTEQALAALIQKDMPDCELVLTIANGANPLARGVARHLSRLRKNGQRVEGLETQKKDDGTFRVCRGNIFVKGRNVVVVDDAFTAGTNIGLVADTVERFGGVVMGAAVVLNRNEDGLSTIDRINQDPITVHSVIQRPITTYITEAVSQTEVN